MSKPLVATLAREDFNRMSNRQLIASALDKKIPLRLFFEGAVIDHALIVRYDPADLRQDRYFPAIDFRNPDFVAAIEPYVVGGGRAILALAPHRGIGTAVRQIFGPGGLEILSTGSMEAGTAPANTALSMPDSDGFKPSGLANVLRVDFGARRNGPSLR